MPKIDESIAIRVEHVSKNFILPHEKNSSVKSAAVNLFKTKTKEAEVQHALQDISFDIKQGEFFGIVGRNGSGKSTLLKILANIYQPTKGEVWHTGKLVPFIELGVGFNPELTGRENVYLNGALLGFTRKEVESMYDDIVRFAELEHFMDQKLKNYSSGMQVRLAFSLAVQAEADVLLIDEVLAVGDTAFQQKCLNYFYRLKKEKKTVVFISHDMDAVEQFCDRAVMIDRSKLVFEGTAHEVANRYRKLFADENSTDGEGGMKAEGRWGDGHAKYLSMNTKISKDCIDIEAELSFDATIDPKELLCGFSILGNNQRLIGTNNRIEEVDLAEYIENGKEGTLKIMWRIPNILASGDYTIEMALESPVIGKTHDWFEDAMHFSILRERNTHHTVEPNVLLEIIPTLNSV